MRTTNIYTGGNHGKTSFPLLLQTALINVAVNDNKHR